MSNSPLVDIIGLSPYNYGKRTNPISRITIHCIVGNFAVERLPLLFDNEECSCNYAIAEDGKVALITDESQGAWCSSSFENDNISITIECSSLAVEPYTFNDCVYDTAIRLTADCMKRNGLNKLVFINDREKALSSKLSQNEALLTFHKWFAAKACPGYWFIQRANDFVQKVNQLLEGGVYVPTPVENTAPTNLYKVQIGAYKNLDNAKAQGQRAKDKGFGAFVYSTGSLYKVQIGAFSSLKNASNLAEKAKQAGFNVYVYGE